MSDDMGFSDVGCYGSEISTPNLDKLGFDGIRFSHFYNTARCCPTRASLLTGLYPTQAGIGFMLGDESEPGYRGDLNKTSVTIAEVLKQAGYNTYMSGKWHVTNKYSKTDSVKENWPNQRGFEKFYGTIGGAGSYYDPYSLARNNDFITPENDPEYNSQKFYYTDAITDNATRFIESHAKEKGKKPFFMYIAYTAPHWPLHAPEEDVLKYKGVYDNGISVIRQERFRKLKELGITDQNWSLSEDAYSLDTVNNKSWHIRNMEVYAAMITKMDNGIGKVVQALKDQGTLENTLILYLQDNGGCAEQLEWLNQENIPDSILNKAIYEPMPKDELQTEVVPAQTREGYTVAIQDFRVPSGSKQSYNTYGPIWANVSNSPFREYKHWVNEGGIASPLIVSWPQKIKSKGGIVHEKAHIIDIMATCIDAARAQYPKSFDNNIITPLEGESLLPVILKKMALTRQSIFFEHEGNRAIISGDWKLVSKANKSPSVYRKLDTLDLADLELYNLKTDRTETMNLADQHPTLVSDLAVQWNEWALRTNTIPKPK